MFRSILPNEVIFFDYFEKHIALTQEACKELYKLSDDDGGIFPPSVKRIKDLEHEADIITHQCVEGLHKTFITPIERSDILALINRLDDIIDNIDGAVSRITMYEIKKIRPEVKDMAEVLIEATGAIERALKLIRKMKDTDEIRKICIHIRQLENKGDFIFRAAICKLFKEEDPITIIKWKEIMERLEMATDRCDHVANVIEGICIENA